MIARPALAGLTSALVGFTSSFAVVLTGLSAVGADPRQAASGLAALSIGMGLLGIALSLRTRMPISIAWSTPGAALLAGTGDGDFRHAVGAFVVCGVLLAAAGFWRPLGRLVAAIPAPLAGAMLAGVLLHLCLAPAQALDAVPRLALPVVITWLVVATLARPWAVPAAVVAAVVAVGLDRHPALPPARSLWPDPVFVTPSFSLAAVLGIGLPLFVVTMAAQNVPGLAVLALHGYRPSPRPLFAATGVGSVATAFLGGHAVNLAAISAALVAGPDAHDDPDRRWPAGVVNGLAYIAFGVVAGAATTLVATAPDVLVAAVGGLGVLGAFVASVTTAVEEPARREAAAVTFLVAASGIDALGLSAAVWALLAGAALLGAGRLRGRYARPA